MRLTASKSSGNFPPPPIPGNELLIPITSWEAMYAETRVTGVEFEQFWFDSVQDGVAYFFSWLGDPRASPVDRQIYRCTRPLSRRANIELTNW